MVKFLMKLYKDAKSHKVRLCDNCLNRIDAKIKHKKYKQNSLTHRLCVLCFNRLSLDAISQSVKNIKND